LIRPSSLRAMRSAHVACQNKNEQKQQQKQKAATNGTRAIAAAGASKSDADVDGDVAVKHPSQCLLLLLQRVMPITLTTKTEQNRTEERRQNTGYYIKHKDRKVEQIVSYLKQLTFSQLFIF